MLSDEKQLSSTMPKDSLVPMDSSRHLGVMGILREALNIPCRNKKLMLPVLLLAFLPCSLLLMGNYVSIYPLLLNIIIKLYFLTKIDPSIPQFHDLFDDIKKDAEAFMNINLIFTVASYVVSFFSMIMIIYASAMTYSGKQLSFYEFARIKVEWKGPFVTRVHFTLLYIGYAVLSVSLTAILMLNVSKLVSPIVLGALLALSACLLYVYLAMVWTLGIVISVLEEGCYGMKAMGKAGELVKGKRMQGFLIAFILMLVGGVLSGSHGIGIALAKPQVGTQTATGLVLLNLFLLLKMLSQMVYSVFYYECRKSQGKMGEVLGEITYTRVPVTPNDDESLP